MDILLIITPQRAPIAEEVCRTCLSNENLLPIFPDSTDHFQKSYVLLTTTGLQIALSDGLSQYICQPCVELVNSALKLRDQSVRAQKVLVDKHAASQLNAINVPYEQTLIEENHNNYNPNKTYRNEVTIVHSEPYIPELIGENTIRNCPDVNIEFVNDEVLCRIPSSPVAKDINQTAIKSDNTLNVTNKNITTVKVSNEKKENKSVQTNLPISAEKMEKVKRFEEKKKREDEYVKSVLKPKRKFYRMSEENEAKYLSLAKGAVERDGPIKCKICSRVLGSTNTFVTHAKSHYDAQNICKICGKGFSTKNGLRNHQIRIHGAERSHHCQQCDFKGADLDQLRNHERRAHTGERPFVCDECGASFLNRANICQHMLKHFGVKKISCDCCPSMFRSRSELATHKAKAHEVKYIYLCYLCPNRYSSVGSTRTHLKNKHDIPRKQQNKLQMIKESKK